MAISNYLQKCDYRIGGLKPYIYLIHKDALKLNFKAKGVEVSFKKTKDGDIYKVNGAMCVFNQEETYHNKYRFNNTLEVTINEQYKEPFFYGLRTLRTNEYYIIVEDKKGVQYLINAELYTNLNYEYNFSDTANVQNAVLLTWNNLSNYPLLIMEERIETDKLLLGEECPYNLGQAFSLIMTHHNDLKTKDDGVKATEIYIDDVDKIKRIEYLKESFTLNETYDGNMFRVTLTYSIPLDDNQFNWHYNLLEFEKNRYTAVLRTTNDNYIIAGIEKGLFPKYNIQTSEDDETPNMINITFEQLSQYPIIFTDDITQYRWIDDAPMCFGYDRYQMLVQQYSEDWGETWETTEPIVKKKGDLIEKDSSYCKQYQWVDDGTYCKEITTEYVQWRETSLFVCEDGNKYEKLQKYSSTDGKTYSPQDEYIKGDLIEENSKECSYVAIRWVDATDGYICFPINEDLTEWREVQDVTTCVDYGSYKLEKEYITNNGNIYYESGEERVGDLVKRNDYNCGWRQSIVVCNNSNTYCTTAITDTTVETVKYVGLTCDLYDDEFNYGSISIKGKGTYTLNIQLPSIYNDYKYDFYMFASRLDEDVIYTATTSTSNTVGSNYNKCVYYGGYKNGNWTYTINDDEEHNIQLGYLIKNKKNVSIVTTFLITRPLQSNTLYKECRMADVRDYIDGTFVYYTFTTIYIPIEYNSCDCGYVGYDWKCGDENGLETICGSVIGDSYDSTSMYEVWREYEKCEGTETGNIEYRNPQKDCDCGYREYDWDSIDGEGYEYICGSVLNGDYPRLTISKVEGNWARESNTFTSNDINDSETTVQRIYFNLSKPSDLTFTIDQSSESSYDYLIIGNLDKTVTDTTSTGSSYNYYNHKGKTTGTTSMTINDTNEHFIELMYRKDGSQSSNRDNVIVTLGASVVLDYDDTSMYEVWREYAYCPTDDTIKEYTGNIEYRNPQKSYDCGWITYQWREDEDNVCGNALPDNTTEVNEAPELNTDFE